MQPEVLVDGRGNRMASSDQAIHFFLAAHEHLLPLMTPSLIDGLIGARGRNAGDACLRITISPLNAMFGFGPLPGDVGRGNSRRE